MRYFIPLLLALRAGTSLAFGIKTFMLINSSSSLWPATFTLFYLAIALFLLLLALTFLSSRSPQSH